ncbi:fukutin-like isoform X2 [Dendronephthya gigantea]|uniref:fukutin-like isoform X2 n=1 Tax=Dendronephthya gigantea TaxID=151771 RepID=UPI00106A7481|nr:fukutin-like isoform X2 [Dendronephthya gigantea]
MISRCILMQRSLVLFFLSLVSVTFLWIQISMYNNINRGKQSFLVNIAPAWISSKHKDLKKTGQNLLSLLDDFLETCSENRITIIIIDPTVLKSVLDDVNSQKTHHRKGCYHFCQKPIITLGVLESRLNPSGLNARVLHSLKEKKIVYTSVTGQDPRLIKLNGTMEKLVPFHYLFTRLDVIIHVIVFYDRKALGLWHGSISWKDFAINLDKKLISYYFHNESVLNRFSLDISTVDGYTIRLPSEIDEFLKNLNTSRYLPCNMKRARQFYSKYGDDGTSKAGTFRKRGKEVLKIAKIILDDLRVRFWLSSGTCLGWFRQCSVISHGKDMDIGMWITDYNKQLIDEFQNNGLYLEHLFGRKKLTCGMEGLRPKLEKNSSTFSPTFHYVGQNFSE